MKDNDLILVIMQFILSYQKLNYNCPVKCDMNCIFMEFKKHHYHNNLNLLVNLISVFNYCWHCSFHNQLRFYKELLEININFYQALLILNFRRDCIKGKN